LQRKEKKTSYSTLTGAFEIATGAKGIPNPVEAAYRFK
jgi:hypothetical protein